MDTLLFLNVSTGFHTRDHDVYRLKFHLKFHVIVHALQEVLRKRE